LLIHYTAQDSIPRVFQERLDELTFEEKQRILRLLNIQGRVGDGKIYLSGCVPTWGKDREKFDCRTFKPDQLP